MHPAIVRRLILPLHEALLRRPTLRRLAEFERSQWATEAELRELQTAGLRRLLTFAATRRPFHAERFAAAGIDPARAMPDDLQRLTPLSKADLRANLDRLVVRDIPGGVHRMSTGGSSGQPLTFFVDRSRQAADQAARARSRRWFGIEPGERELYLWGSPLELSRQDRVKRLRDRLYNHRLLDAFALTPARMSAYLAELRRFDPVHVFGYPSSLARLARHAREQGGSTPGERPNASLRAVFVTGEVLDPADRRDIEAYFHVPVANGYGSREAGFIAHECPHGRLHVTADSMIVELLDEQGQPVASDERGEVVVTHLEAFGMPFIRYRTGDVACWDPRPCPCGRKLPVLQRIEGRRTDMLRTADGGHAHALSVMYVLRESPLVREFKVRQRSNLDLDVLLVPAAPVDDVHRRSLTTDLSRRLGGVGVNLTFVDAIPPDPSGKHRCVTAEA